MQQDNHRQRRTIEATETAKRAGYTIKDWCYTISISAAYFYELKNKGLIDTAKIFGKVIVLTDPREFVERFREKAVA